MAGGSLVGTIGKDLDRMLEQSADPHGELTDRNRVATRGVDAETVLPGEPTPTSDLTGNARTAGPGVDAPMMTQNEVAADIGQGVARGEVNNAPRLSAVPTAGSLHVGPVGQGTGVNSEFTSKVSGAVSPESQKALMDAQREALAQRAATLLESAQALGANSEAMEAFSAALSSDVDESEIALREAQAEIQNLDNQVDQIINRLATTQPNPDRFFSSRGEAARFSSAVAVGVGAFASGLTGQPNFALDIINKAIDRDIRAQELELQRNTASVSAGINLLGQLKSIYNSDIAAREKLREMKWQQAKAQMQANNMRAQSVTTRRAVDAMVAEASLVQAEARANSDRERVSGTITSASLRALERQRRKFESEQVNQQRSRLLQKQPQDDEMLRLAEESISRDAVAGSGGTEDQLFADLLSGLDAQSVDQQARQIAEQAVPQVTLEAKPQAPRRTGNPRRSVDAADQSSGSLSAKDRQFIAEQGAESVVMDIDGKPARSNGQVIPVFGTTAAGFPVTRQDVGYQKLSASDQAKVDKELVLAQDMTSSINRITAMLEDTVDQVNAGILTPKNDAAMRRVASTIRSELFSQAKEAVGLDRLSDTDLEVLDKMLALDVIEKKATGSVKRMIGYIDLVQNVVVDMGTKVQQGAEASARSNAVYFRSPNVRKRKLEGAGGSTSTIDETVDQNK